MKVLSGGAVAIVLNDESAAVTNALKLVRPAGAGRVRSLQTMSIRVDGDDEALIQVRGLATGSAAGMTPSVTLDGHKDGGWQSHALDSALRPNASDADPCVLVVRGLNHALQDLLAQSVEQLRVTVQLQRDGVSVSAEAVSVRVAMTAASEEQEALVTATAKWGTAEATAVVTTAPQTRTMRAEASNVLGGTVTLDVGLTVSDVQNEAVRKQVTDIVAESVKAREHISHELQAALRRAPVPTDGVNSLSTTAQSATENVMRAIDEYVAALKFKTPHSDNAAAYLRTEFGTKLLLLPPLVSLKKGMRRLAELLCADVNKSAQPSEDGKTRRIPLWRAGRVGGEVLGHFVNLAKPADDDDDEDADAAADDGAADGDGEDAADDERDADLDPTLVRLIKELERQLQVFLEPVFEAALGHRALPIARPSDALVKNKCVRDAAAIIGVSYALQLEVARREAVLRGEQVDWTKTKARVASLPYSKAGAWNVTPHAMFDFRDALGVNAASGKTEFQRLCALVGEAKARAVVDRLARNHWHSAYQLGKTIVCDGQELLLHVVKASRHGRVCKDGNDPLSRRLQAALVNDPGAKKDRTRALYRVGPGYGSYRVRLLREAVLGDSFPLTPQEAFDLMPTQKPPKKDADAANDCGFGGVADALRQQPVDFFTADELRGAAVYEKASRDGVLRGALTWAGFRALLMAVHTGIDTGQVDWLFIVVGVLRVSADDTSDEGLLRHVAQRLRELDGARYGELADATPVHAAHVEAILSELDFAVLSRRVHGAKLEYSKPRTSTAAEAAARQRAAAAGVAGQRVVDPVTFLRFADIQAKTFSATMLATLQRTKDGDASKRRKERKAVIAEAAEAPLVAAQQLLAAMGVAATSRQARDRMVVFLGNPTWCSSEQHGGNRSAPAKALRDEIAARYKTLIIDEYLTSQQCPTCGDKLERTRARRVRYWRCGKCDADGREHNKDYLAAVSMIQIGITLLLTGSRPAPWRRPERKPKGSAASQSAKRKAGSAAPAKRGKRESSTTRRKRRADDDNDDNDDDVDDKPTSATVASSSSSSAATAAPSRSSGRKRRNGGDDDDDDDYDGGGDDDIDDVKRGKRKLQSSAKQAPAKKPTSKPRTAETQIEQTPPAPDGAGAQVRHDDGASVRGSTTVLLPGDERRCDCSSNQHNILG